MDTAPNPLSARERNYIVGMFVGASIGFPFGDFLVLGLWLWARRSSSASDLAGRVALNLGLAALVSLALVYGLFLLLCAAQALSVYALMMTCCLLAAGSSLTLSILAILALSSQLKGRPYRLPWFVPRIF